MGIASIIPIFKYIDYEKKQTKKQVIKIRKSTIKVIYVKHNLVVWETGDKKTTLVFIYDLKIQPHSNSGQKLKKDESLLLWFLTEKFTLP